MEGGGARGTAHARAALAGNPSDGHEGAVLAFTFREFAATARVAEPTAELAPGLRDLVEAATARFRARTGLAVEASGIQCSTTIPRQVGLGGSSAIVIATLRALCDAHGASLSPNQLASTALAAETEELGIAAGPQDRFAQAHGGLVLMDFSEGIRVKRLDAALLPPLFIAWRPEGAAPSGVAHRDLRSRAERDPGEVATAMSQLAGLAREAAAVLERGEPERLGRLMDESFEVRRRLLDLDPVHVRMIEIARAHGASANYAGSGGAIVGTRAPGEGWERLSAAFADEGARALEPHAA